MILNIKMNPKNIRWLWMVLGLIQFKWITDHRMLNNSWWSRKLEKQNWIRLYFDCYMEVQERVKQNYCMIIINCFSVMHLILAVKWKQNKKRKLMKIKIVSSSTWLVVIDKLFILLDESHEEDWMENVVFYCNEEETWRKN